MTSRKLTSSEPFAVPPYDGAKKAYRIFPYFWHRDDAFEATCEGLLKYKDCVDEITFFCDHMHCSYMPDDMLYKYADIAARRVKTLRELGFKSVGYNMLHTVGHGDYYIDQCPVPPMQTSVDLFGTQSAVQLCPRSDEFKEYIMHKYAVFAEGHPNFMWIDDDLRVPDKVASITCCCDGCMSKFNKLYGYSFDRESLLKAFTSGKNDAETQKLRRQWSEYNLQAYVDMMDWLREAVHGVDPSIEMGLMTVHLAANEYLFSDYTDMAKHLGAVKNRPGGGFHHEGNLRELFCKTAGTMEQMAQVAFIPDRQYEVEDFPQTYYKSDKTHILECTAGIMDGGTGIAFASIPPDMGNDNVMTAIRNASGMWDDMVRRACTWKLYGGSIVYNKDYGVYADNDHYINRAGFSFFNALSTPFAHGFLPQTPYWENSVLGFISEDMVASLSDAEIKSLFAKGVMLDGRAAEILVERGYASLVGCNAAIYNPDHSAERYLTNDLNGKVSNTLRYMYSVAAENTYRSNPAGVPQHYHGEGLYNFDLMEGAKPLSVSEDIDGNSGSCASYVYENSLGGRVCVMGYLPWGYFGTWQRLEQTATLVEWLTRGKNPVKIMNEELVASLIKQPEDRSKFMMMLINATTDDTVDNLEVRILGEYKCDFMFYDEKSVSHVIPASEATVANGYTTLRLPKMTGWGFCVVYTL